MDMRNFQAIRDVVFRSFETLRDPEYDFLGDRRDTVLEARPCLERLIGRIESRLVLEPAFNPWAEFRVSADMDPYPAPSRHRNVALNGASARAVGVVQGTFDPFHLGHLMVGLEAIADGTCDFVAYMPNSDRPSAGSSRKPNKSAHPWRMRTALAGGVDDFFPLTRASTFGRDVDAAGAYARLVGENRDIIERGDGLDLVIIIGSDIVIRPDFVPWTNASYAALSATVPAGKLRFRFRVVERAGYAGANGGGGEGSEGDLIRDILAGLDYPWHVVREVSCASSTSIRRDGAGAVYLYPRAITLLEAFLLYSRADGAGTSGSSQ